MERRNINTVGTIFNDFLGLYTGERPVGIRELIQKYDKHPVLMGMWILLSTWMSKRPCMRFIRFIRNIDIVRWTMKHGKPLWRVRRRLKRSGMETFGYAG